MKIMKEGVKTTIQGEPSELLEFFKGLETSSSRVSEMNTPERIPFPKREAKKPEKFVKKFRRGRSRTVSLETIKKIKELSKEIKSSREIGKQLGISRNIVKYWRIHTPKELKME